MKRPPSHEEPALIHITEQTVADLEQCAAILVVRGTMKKKRKYTRRHGAKPPGRPKGKYQGTFVTEVGELALREGISRQAAWYRLRLANCKPSCRPRKASSPASVTNFPWYLPFGR